MTRTSRNREQDIKTSAHLYYKGRSRSNEPPPHHKTTTYLKVAEQIKSYQY